MTARKYDIEVEQGATFVMTLTYKNALGVAVDLTNYAVAMQIRESVGGRIYASASVANGRITADVTGTIVVTIPAADTRLMSSERGVYDLFLTAPSGVIATKMLYGDVEITPSVTR